MGLGLIATIAERGLLYWLAALAVLILYRCLRGGISLSGMLAHDVQRSEEGFPAPERVQLLVMFLIALAAYARQALVVTQAPGAAPSMQLPEVPSELLALFAASNAIYLSGKLGRTIFNGRSSKRGNDP